MEQQLTPEQRQRRIQLNGLLAAIHCGEITDVTDQNPNDVSIEGIHMARTLLHKVQLGVAPDEIDQLKV
ncbi:hypothetical protein HY312_03750 [Candidatus Saccharibacteria bacterium]|nr:hypothetical protein [Candidatus Saccharibacteria bacterium]